MAKVTTEQTIKVVYPLKGDVISSINNEKTTIKKSKYQLTFFLFNTYRVKPTIEQSDKTILTPYFNNGNFNKGYCVLNKPIIAKTNNGKRNVIAKNNINNLFFIKLFLNIYKNDKTLKFMFHLPHFFTYFSSFQFRYPFYGQRLYTILISTRSA